MAAAPKPSQVDTTTAAIRERILSGELGPGVQLREVELAEALGVGRHSLRAALQALAHEGLVRHEPNRGAFVPRLTVADVEDIFRLRRALEAEAVRELAKRGDGVPAVVDVLERMRAVGPGDSWALSVELDLAFHRELIDAVDSPRMSRGFAAIQTELRLLLAQLRSGYADPAVLVDEHAPILAAVLSGKPSAAVKAIRAHLAQGVRDLADQLR